MNNNSINKKNKLKYQYVDGSYLPDNSLPGPNYETKYTPHESTRYRNVATGYNGLEMTSIKAYLKDTEKKLPELYQHRENCCGCTACYAVCPTKAISMEPDEEAFLYPVVNASLCIQCYKCISVCGFKVGQKEKGYL